jgi:hypothetical protein
MMSSEHKTLFKKLNNVMSRVGSVDAAGRFGQTGYKFQRWQDIFARLQQLFVEEGIVFLPSCDTEKMDLHRFPRGDNKAPGIHVVVPFKMTFACTETGQTMVMPWIGESIDYSDKAVNQAMTSAVKYFLRNTFLIQTEETDPDQNRPEIPVQPALPPNRDAEGNFVLDDWKKFWMWTKDLGLTNEEVREAADVKSIKSDWKGTKRELMTVIEAFADAKKAEQDSPKVDPPNGDGVNAHNYRYNGTIAYTVTGGVTLYFADDMLMELEKHTDLKERGRLVQQQDKDGTEIITIPFKYPVRITYVQDGKKFVPVSVVKA